MNSLMPSLEGQVAIVTGAARGIGYEYAVRLAALGAKVAICDRNLESFKEFEAEHKRAEGRNVGSRQNELGIDCMQKQVDVTDPLQVASFVQDVIDRWGRIDVVVCNAGGGGDLTGSNASVLDPQTTQAMLEKNLLSVIYTCTAVVPVMKRQGRGTIINVTSIGGISANKGGNAADYSIAKAGVAHYTRLLAQELGPFGIRVNAIAPGFIASGQLTERFGKNKPGQLEQWAAQVPLRRLGTPEDCAKVIQFLATDLSDYVTGQVITVDGGMLQ